MESLILSNFSMRLEIIIYTTQIDLVQVTNAPKGTTGTLYRILFYVHVQIVHGTPSR